MEQDTTFVCQACHSEFPPGTAACPKCRLWKTMLPVAAAGAMCVLLLLIVLVRAKGNKWPKTKDELWYKLVQMSPPNYTSYEVSTFEPDTGRFYARVKYNGMTFGIVRNNTVGIDVVDVSVVSVEDRVIASYIYYDGKFQSKQLFPHNSATQLEAWMEQRAMLLADVAIKVY